MLLHPGIFLKSTPALNNSVFEDSIIYITEYNNHGAMGFVINKQFRRALNELMEFSNSPAFPLYHGGPVDNEHLFFLHNQPQHITDGVLVAENIYLGGNFSQAVTAINNNTLDHRHIKIFIGYCGWDADELEAELAEGSWELIMNKADVFMV